MTGGYIISQDKSFNLAKNILKTSNEIKIKTAIFEKETLPGLWEKFNKLVISGTPNDKAFYKVIGE